MALSYHLGPGNYQDAGSAGTAVRNSLRDAMTGSVRFVTVGATSHDHDKTGTTGWCSASYHIQDKVRVGLIRYVGGHLDSAIAAGVAVDS